MGPLMGDIAHTHGMDALSVRIWKLEATSGVVVAISYSLNIVQESTAALRGANELERDTCVKEAA